MKLGDLFVCAIWMSGGETNNPAHASAWDFAGLLFSVAIWILSLFFLTEAVRILRWTLRGAEKPLRPDSGEELSYVVSSLMVVAWFFVSLKQVGMEPGEGVVPALFRGVLEQPRTFIPGFVLASTIPTTIALFKLTTAVVMSLRHDPEEHKARRPLWAVLIYVAFNLLNGAASIVTLSKAIRP